MGMDMNVERTITIFDGTRLDVYNAVEFLVKKAGYIFFNRDLVVREPEMIESQYDIQKGDFILFGSPHNETMCIGFDIGNDVMMDRVGYCWGYLNNFPEDTRMGLDLYRLSKDDTLREMYEDMMDVYKSDFYDILANLKDVLSVDTTEEELFDFIFTDGSQINAEDLTVYYLGDEGVEHVVVQSEMDIEPGMIVCGERYREDGSRQLVFMGCDLTDDMLMKFLREDLGEHILSEKTPEIKHIKYDEFMDD